MRHPITESAGRLTVRCTSRCGSPRLLNFCQTLPDLEIGYADGSKHNSKQSRLKAGACLLNKVATGGLKVPELFTAFDDAVEAVLLQGLCHSAKGGFDL